MGDAPRRRPPEALALLAYAVTATRLRTRAEALSCNASLLRTRDFLAHAPARDLAVAGLPISAAEFESLRAPALAEMRARCQACALCLAERIPLP